MIRQLAEALHVHPSAISNQNANAYINLMYNLFDMENTFGIHIDQIDGELCLRMDRMNKQYVTVYDHLLEWYEECKKGRTGFEAGTMYEEWKLNYPPVAKREKRSKEQ
jgi:DNA-directed RNA polymerase specialized sigma54-like protein